MRKTGENSRVSSQHNRGLILKLIATGQCHSRIELAKETELTKMTITNIVSEFRQNDYVVEAEERPNDVRGRNPITVEISQGAPKVIGVLVAKDHCEAVLCDLNLKILKRERSDYNPGMTGDILFSKICCLIDCMLEEEKRIFGIGVASIGPINITEGKLLNPVNFYGICDMNLAELLGRVYDYPIFVDHDSNSAALAEALYGAGKKYHDFVYLGISDDIGSAVVTEGDLFRNRKGYAPEIGHICINRHGKPCVCGNAGCLQAYAGVSVVMEKLVGITGADLNFQEFCRLEKDVRVEAVLKEMMDDLAVALVSSVNVLHPESVILGHEGVYLQDRYLKYLEDQINTHKFIQGQTNVTVSRAGFLKDAQLVGAACNVIMEVFKGTLPIRRKVE